MFKRLLKFSGFKLSLLITLGLCFHYLFTLLGFNPLSMVTLLDKKVVDLIQASRGAKVLNPQIVIATIDTKSVDKFGRWPWPREIMAQLLEQLAGYYEIEVLGYDAVFSEPDPNDQTTLKVIRRFGEAAKSLDSSSKNHIQSVEALSQRLSVEMQNDRIFGEALQKYGKKVVNGYFFFADPERVKHLTAAEKEQSSARVAPSAIKIIRGINHLAYTPLYEGVAVESNIGMLSPESAIAGYFNVFPDSEDGTVRRVHLVMRYQDQYFPSLDLQLLSRHLGDAPISMSVGEAGIEGFMVGEKKIETDSDGSVMINYRGPAASFPHYSVWDLIKRKVPKADLAGKVVLLGATEVGVFDLRTTPVGVDFPGVEVHANLLDNLIHGDYFYVSELTNLLTLLGILLLGLFVGLVVPRLKAISGALFALVLGAAIFGADAWFLTRHQTWLSFSYLLGTVALNWLAIMLYNYFGEEKDKRFIKGAFGQYMAPQVIDELVKNPGLLKLGGERREITAFFSDIQGFSTLSESLSPEELVILLNEYLTAMTDIIMRHGGTVDKFEGDAIIAFFGAPIPYADHAKRACAASLEMQEKLGQMRAAWREKGRPELKMRIGLNTTVAVVGNMGSAQRMDYTMMGDGVNLAARLEGVNKEYKTYLMVSETTQQASAEDFEFRELDWIRVVGKQARIRIYEILGPKGCLDDEALKLEKFFQKGLGLYRRKEFGEAAKYFSHFAKQNPQSGAAAIFLERCRQFTKSPPPENWDGVFQMTNK